MDIPDIKYTSLQRKLQLLSMGSTVILQVFGGTIGAIILIYFTFYTRYWMLTLLYIIWAYILDTDTCNRGSRRIQWVCNWSWWRYEKNYFPSHLKRVPSAKLDPKRNYLFCCFPHGICGISYFMSFGPEISTFRELFPNHAPHLATLKMNFYLPFVRDFWLAFGLCNSSARSLNWLLSYSKGGKVVALVVGGASEALNCRPGEYRICLKKRKGFVKIALRNGLPLVPVISFGETDLYNQLNNPEGSFLRRLQEWVKNKVGFAPCMPIGRGFFQESLGLIPLRKPLITVVGKPLEVVKTEHPTQAQIDFLHAEFVEKLTELFEEQKVNYLANPDKVSLIIE